MKKKIFNIILEAYDNILCGNELKDDEMIQKANCKKVTEHILQTVYKEIEKKINKLEVSSIAVCGGEQGTMMMSDFIEKDEVKEVIKQIMEVEE